MFERNDVVKILFLFGFSFIYFFEPKKRGYLQGLWNLHYNIKGIENN